MDPVVLAALADILEHVVSVGNVGVAAVFANLSALIALAVDLAGLNDGIDGDVDGGVGGGQSSEGGEDNEELHVGGWWVVGG